MTTIAALSAAIPFFEAGHIRIPFPGIDHIDLQYFGILVATGVLIGAALMRRYAEKYGCDEDDIRGMTGWVVVTGFIGAHVFDVLAYQQSELAHDPMLIVKLWKGISSYGGFIGGFLGWAFYQWWKRFATGTWADITVVGLLPAFSIGRIGCTVVSDHIGSPTASALGMDYPLSEVKGRLCPQFGDVCPSWLDAAYKHHDDIAHLGVVSRMHEHAPQLNPPMLGGIIRLHNLGLNELLYLIPVNLLILYLAFFYKRRRLPAGMLAALTGVFYAPVRFFFEFLRPDQTDPRYIGLTFAQWASIMFFLAAVGGAVWLLKNGQPAPLADDIDPKLMGGRKDKVPRLLNAVEKAKDKDAKDKDAKDQDDKAETKKEPRKKK
jgi:phosphatidylglycerol:prolipoprotein diacylglycerol transferase